MACKSYAQIILHLVQSGWDVHLGLCRRSYIVSGPICWSGPFWRPQRGPTGMYDEIRIVNLFDFHLTGLLIFSLAVWNIPENERGNWWMLGRQVSLMKFKCALIKSVDKKTCYTWLQYKQMPYLWKKLDWTHCRLLKLKHLGATTSCISWAHILLVHIIHVMSLHGWVTPQNLPRRVHF